MQIKVICEKRNHLNESDVFYPVVLCDVCGKRIEDISQANYHFNFNNCEYADFYKHQSDIWLVHKNCDMKIHSMIMTSKGESFIIETPFGQLKSEDMDAHWLEMQDFIDHLIWHLDPKNRINAEKLTHAHICKMKQ